MEAEDMQKGAPACWAKPGKCSKGGRSCKSPAGRLPLGASLTSPGLLSPCWSAFRDPPIVTHAGCACFCSATHANTYPEDLQHPTPPRKVNRVYSLNTGGQQDSLETVFLFFDADDFFVCLFNEWISFIYVSVYTCLARAITYVRLTIG